LKIEQWIKITMELHQVLQPIS